MPKASKKTSHFSSHPSAIAVITAEILLGIGLCFFFLFVFLCLANEVLDKDLNKIDLMVSWFVYSLRTPVLTQVMIFISSLGRGMCMLFSVLVLVTFLIKKHHKEAVLFCLALIMGLILNNSLKHICQRARPEMSPLVIERSYSFPSGHAMNAFIFYGLLSYFSYHFFRNKTLTIVSSCIAVVLILLIGFSRIYLGVHYFTDVIAGYLTGMWWFMTVLVLDRTLIFYKLFKKSD